MPTKPTTIEPSSAWAPYAPGAAAPWNRRRVVHLHRRAGFAATWAEQQRDLADGPQRVVDRLLSGGTSSDDEIVKLETMAGTIGDAAQASNNANRLKAWWLYRMLFSPDPLGERLTLLWHNQFATRNRKVQDLVLMREQNELLRVHARGTFGELLPAVVKHPAMLVWLDADSNRKGHPNENLARELLELFTIGIGNYNEDDVQAAARALTGWAIVDGKFGFRQARHDDGTKSLLGTTSTFNGDELLAILVEHPATARRIAERLCRTFLGETIVSDEAMTVLTDGLRERNLDIGWGVETILRSHLFFSEESLGHRIAGPVEWSIGLLRALELLDPPPSTLLLAEWTTRMGHDLFYPPNVGGWREGRAWLGSQAVVARANFAAALVEGRLWNPARGIDLPALVRRHGSTDDLDASIAWITELLWGHAPSDTVAEVVRAASREPKEKRLPTAMLLLLSRPESYLC